MVQVVHRPTKIGFEVKNIRPGLPWLNAFGECRLDLEIDKLPLSHLCFVIFQLLLPVHTGNCKMLDINCEGKKRVRNQKNKVRWRNGTASICFPMPSEHSRATVGGGGINWDW